MSESLAETRWWQPRYYYYCSNCRAWGARSTGKGRACHSKLRHHVVALLLVVVALEEPTKEVANIENLSVLVATVLGTRAWFNLKLPVVRRNLTSLSRTVEIRDPGRSKAPQVLSSG